MPELALDPPETLRALVSGSTAEPRFRSWLVAAFAATALGLAVLGLYSLVSYTVAGRTREIATRLALGATPAAMRAGVMREGLALTGAGLAVGLGTAAALGRLVEGLLYETAPLDPAVTAAPRHADGAGRGRGMLSAGPARDARRTRPRRSAPNDPSSFLAASR